MATTKITTPQTDTVYLEKASAILTPQATVNISRAANYAEAQDAAIRITAESDPTLTSRLIANSNITLTNSTSNMIYGIYGLNDTSDDPNTRIVNHLSAKKLKITAKQTSENPLTVSGIEANATLTLGQVAGERFLTSLDLTAANQHHVTVTGYNAKKIVARNLQGMQISATSAKQDAEAFGFNASKGELSVDAVLQDMTITARGNTAANALGFSAIETITLGELSGKLAVSATANTGEANASAFRSTKILQIGTGAKDIVVAANGNHAVSAYGFLINGGAVLNTLAGKLTVGATTTSTTEDAVARGFSSGSEYHLTLGSLTGNVAISAKGKAGARAHGFLLGGAIDAKKLAGKFAVSAASTTSCAFVEGIASFAENITIDTMTGALTASASSTQNSAFALGILSGTFNLQYQTLSLAKKVSVKNLAGDLTVSASTGKKSEEAFAVAYGIAGNEIEIDSLGKATITATAAQNDADAVGLRSQTTLKIGNVAKDVAITANGNNDATASGFTAIESSITVDTLAGKLTVSATGKNGESNAYGMLSGDAITVGTVAKNLAVTAKGRFNANAYGLRVITGKAIDVTMLAGKTAVSASATLVYAIAGGVASDGGDVTIDEMTGALTATASSKTLSAFALGIASGYVATQDNFNAFLTGTNVILGDVTGDITVSATGGTNNYEGYDACALAYGIAGKVVSVKSLGNMTANAIAKDNKADAVGLLSGKTLSVTELAGKTTVSAKSKDADASASAIKSTEAMTIVTVDKDLSVSAVGKTYATGYAFRSEGTFSLTALSGKLTVSATANTSANATGAYSHKEMTLGMLANDISVTAKGGLADAYGFKANIATLALGELSGTLTVSATGTDKYSYAYGIRSAKAMTVGTISKEISILAKGASSATAYGLYSLNNTITGNTLSGKITIRATAGTTAADARGIVSAQSRQDTLTDAVKLDAMTKALTATAASSKSSAYALGISSGTIMLERTGSYFDAGNKVILGAITGDITVSASAGTNDGTDDESKAYAIADAIAGYQVSVKSLGKVTVNAAAKKNYADAKGLYAASAITIGSVDKDILVTAKGNTSSEAGGIVAENDVIQIDKMTGALTVSASSTQDHAYALGIVSGRVENLFLITMNTVVLGAITGDITVSASSGYNEELKALACGIAGTRVSIESLGKMTVSASAQRSRAETFGIKSNEAITIGNVAKDITVTAKGKLHTATGYGFVGAQSLDIRSFSGKFTVSAISEEADATAKGMCTNEALTIGSVDKDISVTAKGRNEVEARGLESGSNTITIDTLSGKTTVSASAATAYAHAQGISSMKTTSSASNDMIKIKKMTGALTVTADCTEGSAFALGILSGRLAPVENLLYFGLNTVLGDVAGDITVSASAGTNAENYANGLAYGIVGNEISIESLGKMTVSASAKRDYANGFGAYAANNLTIGTVAKALAVTAKGNTSSEAGGIVSQNGVIQIDKMTGALTVSADCAKGSAYAFGIRSGKLNPKEGILEYGRKIVLGEVTGAINVSASSKDLENAAAYGIAGGEISVESLDKMTVSATAKKGVAYAYGLNSAGNATIGAISGAVSVTAIGNTSAIASGLELKGEANMLSGNLGSWNVSAKATTGLAFGWDIASAWNTSAPVSAKINVTSSAEATGIRFGSIYSGTFDEAGAFTNDPTTDARLQVNITATGKNATAIEVLDSAKFILSDAAIVAKSTAQGDAYALLGSKKEQFVVLEKDAKLTGNIALNDGNDVLEMRAGSIVNGNVDLGDGTDTLTLHTGAQLIGSVSGMEEIVFELDSADYAKTAMLQSADPITGWETIGKNINSLDGLEGTFTLIKTASASDWSAMDSFNLSVNGVDTKLTLNYGASVDYDLFSYALKSSADKKSLLLEVSLIA
ncbi:MAG: hypothetical protein PHS41_03255 [Victivallaceae bacterium]|nr:hypothetical protein [Victivallaceae bacterium]